MFIILLKLVSEIFENFEKLSPQPLYHDQVLFRGDWFLRQFYNLIKINKQVVSYVFFLIILSSAFFKKRGKSFCLAQFFMFPKKLLQP